MKCWPNCGSKLGLRSHNPSWTLQKLQQLIQVRTAWKVEFPFRFTLSWEMGTKLSQWNRFSWFRFSKIHNVPGEWLSSIAAHIGWVPVNSVSTTKASSSTLCSTSASTNPSQRTFLLNGLVPHVLDDVHVSTLREHLFLHMHLHERTPDHRRRHRRRQGLPIAQFCFAIALCAANFKPTVTWKRYCTAIVVGDQSSAVKRFNFVKKVQVLHGFRDKSLRERNSSPLSKIWARTWTWTHQNDLITVKNNLDPLISVFGHFWLLHHGIEEVERHLLWKFDKQIQRKSWSNVPPKLLACVRFLYKVVHKIGRLQKFNRSREIELNFFIAWTIFMKLGTLNHHVHGYKTFASDFLIFALGLSYGLSKSKNGVKSSLNFEKS